MEVVQAFSEAKQLGANILVVDNLELVLKKCRKEPATLVSYLQRSPNAQEILDVSFWAVWHAGTRYVQSLPSIVAPRRTEA
ncbi:MAG: hypothetical protein KVP17_001861 [Porospora cf. gigantea B]|uniref:uncharacterized protein n=1 Tax=Porospora cf. gigantea B TaxID=2853592 RepID=UPI003571A54B|nr:MAG: hypothetical protein KVP17_001861 [Porospora cf. gigantea B]